MNDLERALMELPEHLDIPQTADADADAALARRLAAPADVPRRSRVRVLLAAAAAIAVLSAGTVAVAPARSAVAGWLGIGAVEVRQEAAPPATTPSTTGTRPTRPPISTTDLAGARRAVEFEIAMPTDEEPPQRITVDRRVPGGLVTLTYSHFTLVEIATDQNGPAPLMKLVGGAAVEPMSVHGYDGLWIPTVHQIGFVDRTGRVRSDTVRRSGPVLLWERDGVTYRVEGPHTRAEAQEIADSIV